jgi:ankyrin repeat protein
VFGAIFLCCVLVYILFAYPQSDGDTPLYISVNFGHIPVVRRLIELGADVSHPMVRAHHLSMRVVGDGGGGWGWGMGVGDALSCPCSSPLHGSPQNNGASPIIVACAKGRRECVRLLLDQGCDLSQVREGVT